MAHILGFLVFSILTALFFWSAAQASRDGYFSHEQLEWQGIMVGLPFIANGAMWTDFLLISPLVGFLTAQYAYQWSLKAWLIASFVGIIVSLSMNWCIFRVVKIPEAHARNNRLTIVGWLHTAYMAVALTPIFLFYFATKPTPMVLTATNFALLTHMIAGSHVFPALLRVSWFPVKPFQPMSWIPVLTVAILLLWRTLALLG